MTANSPIPAIANAIFDAVGVRLTRCRSRPSRSCARSRRSSRQPEHVAQRQRDRCRSPEALARALAEQRYLADEGLLDRHLSRAFGSASRCCSKARRASARPKPPRCSPTSCGRELIRLQCYEGIDAAHALYEWNHQRSCSPSARPGDREIDIYDDRFLIARPLLQVLQAPDARLLLIDEIDRSDHEFEALLLEFLSDFQITIPERGTHRASASADRRADLQPHARAAEALRRRCVYHWIAYPDAAREAEIIMARAGDVAEATAARNREGRPSDPRQAARQAPRYRRSNRMGQRRDRAGKGRQPLAGSVSAGDRRADQGRGGHAAICCRTRRASSRRRSHDASLVCCRGISFRLRAAAPLDGLWQCRPSRR